MVSLLLVVVGAAGASSLIGVGGGLYEFSVVDPFWPHRPDLIQPNRGGLSRRRFWIPAHVAFEATLLVALLLAWSEPGIRIWLLVGFASHLVMRLWSAVDFIPKALAFERADAASFDTDAAARWTQRSLLRLPLDLVTAFAMLAAFAKTAQIA